MAAILKCIFGLAESDLGLYRGGSNRAGHGGCLDDDIAPRTKQPNDPVWSVSGDSGSGGNSFW